MYEFNIALRDEYETFQDTRKIRYNTHMIEKM